MVRVRSSLWPGWARRGEPLPAQQRARRLGPGATPQPAWEPGGAVGVRDGAPRAAPSLERLHQGRCGAQLVVQRSELVVRDGEGDGLAGLGGRRRVGVGGSVAGCLVQGAGRSAICVFEPQLHSRTRDISEAAGADDIVKPPVHALQRRHSEYLAFKMLAQDIFLLLVWTAQSQSMFFR